MENDVSPSSRRAWIEITAFVGVSVMDVVALLAEGVDRNTRNGRSITVRRKSPSSRRAWIEMLVIINVCLTKSSPSSRRAWIEINREEARQLAMKVALLAEGVDRNQIIGRVFVHLRRRPPRGGRG